MKRIIVVALLAIMLSGCTQSTPYGKCIGILESGKPHLEYEMSLWNIAIAVIFSETIIIPVVVGFGMLSCPQRRSVD